ncbi:MAG TPA: alpha-amylase/4-alpha-glucanotransferase domain-containing protein [Bacteroidota bacterium]|nr:alpha-amylase/4-alpha-glucanotransferase domain-containing protein [Bacteroidota bacterium]
MKTINLLLGIHNHQPVGNFDSVFTHALEHAYRPFLEVIERFPKIKIAQHYTGVLLDWFRKNHPEILKHIKRLVDSGQIEIMGGSYYEAILSIIPDSDKVSQLEKLSKSLKKEFGTRPSGMWLAERVWEQHLTRFIAEAGLDYIMIDDTHFKYAGYSDEELLGYYRTEDQGKTMAIFPISKMLRYTIPFQSVQRTIDYLRSLATEEGNRIVVFADDGEKFGVWPKTFDHVYKNGWLTEFFTALSDNSGWIKIHHFRDILEMIPATGRTYLPNASYAEMMHWALPAHHFKLYDEFEGFLKNHNVLERFESFFKGGFWRNFLVKYAETNNMHKKMMRVSDRAHRIKDEGKKKVAGGTFEKIWSSQCNDPYWHGVFGGLYLPVLRYPVYRNLISAEADLDRIEKKNNVTWEITDFDCDGKKEILVETPVLNCYIDPDAGGSLFELDFKPISLNLLDIVSRREEGYHHKLAEAAHGRVGGDVASIHDLVVAKEKGLEDHLNYDWYRHGSFIDHFFGPEVKLDEIWRCKYAEEGDFVNQPYEAKVSRRGRSVQVKLSRNGALWRDGNRHRVSVEKTVSISPDSSDITIDYVMRNGEKTPMELCFGAEVCAGLQAGNAPDRYYFSEEAEIPSPQLGSKGELHGISSLGLRDEWLGVEVRIECGTPASFWRFPLETVSLSEAGFERIYQGSVVIPHWKFNLEKEWKCRITQRISKLKQKRNKQ